MRFIRRMTAAVIFFVKAPFSSPDGFLIGFALYAPGLLIFAFGVSIRRFNWVDLPTVLLIATVIALFIAAAGKALTEQSPAVRSVWTAILSTHNVMLELGAPILGLSLLSVPYAFAIIEESSGNSVYFAIFAGLPFAPALVLLGRAKTRLRVVHVLASHTLVVVLIYSSIVFIAALIVFSSVGLVAEKIGVVQLGTMDERGSALNWNGLLIWHALNLIPLLEITETLHWQEPVSTSSSGYGWVVLSFKAAFLLPLTLFARDYWRILRNRSAPKRQSTATMTEG